MIKRNKAVITTFLIFCYSTLILVIGCFSVEFAELYSSTVSACFRKALGYITCLIPFSVAELLVLSVPPVLVIIVVAVSIRVKKTGDVNILKKLVACLLCTVFIILSVFINTFGICYRRYSAEDKLLLDFSTVNNQSVRFVSELLCDNVNESVGFVEFNSDGSSKMPYDLNTLSQKLKRGYDVILKDVPLKFSLKPVFLSEPWTYTHISGMYMPFTGESNLNVNYPDYAIAFSAAHEIAHQLGIAFENDANFYAYLACVSSEDDYLRYAANLTALEYFIMAMPAKEANEVAVKLDARAKGEIIAYNKFFEKYRSNVVADISTHVNDYYLKSQGQQLGEKSYGEVVTLLTAYFNVHNN